MRFDIELNSLETDALSLDYSMVPWDGALLARPVAQIKRIEVRDYETAKIELNRFFEWKEDNRIGFSTAKIPHHALLESRLIQSRNYCFIELNYRPEIEMQGGQFMADRDFEFEEAAQADKERLCGVALRTFSNTRFHLDPLLGKRIGDERYEAWMRNAFDLSHQKVLKCTLKGEPVAFFVQEYPEPDHVFWSLVGLMPDLQGRGLGKDIWQAAMHWLQGEGVSKISTSISSLNTPVLNLYARLGFRFPKPLMTFHWHSQDWTPE